MIVSYKWIQEYFDEPLPDAEELVRLLTLHSFEIEGVEKRGEDTLIDIDVLPNRAHDCLNHRGIAKEVGSILGRDLHIDPLREDLLNLPESEDIQALVDDDLEDTSTIAILVRGVSIKESPDWLKEKLTVLGQRSINNIVDITNYVMLNMGQPLHAFDAKAFGDGVVRIKRAEEGGKLILLGDINVELTTEDIVVSDGSNALDVAGIRGGIDAEIDESTKDIIISSSHFNPTMVRKTAQRLKLWTDAAKRFQNNPTQYFSEHGARECVEIILDLAGGEVIGMARAGSKLPKYAHVELSVERANNLLGLSLTRDEVLDILKRLGASWSGDDVLTVEIPHERMDLRIEEDLIEEVGRLYGYDKLPVAELPKHEASKPHNMFLVFELVRDLLTKEGFSEVYTYVLRDKGVMKLQNALNTEKSYLRTGLTEGLEDAIVLNKNNLPLLGKEHVDIFEIGDVFGSNEKTFLGIATSRKKKEKIFEDIRVKLVEAFGLDVSGKIIGNVFEMDITSVIENIKNKKLPEYQAPEVQFSIPSAYPFALRDVAVWTPEDMPEKSVRESIRSEAGELLYRIDLFDEFNKEGKTSYAYHLVFQSTTETLSDDEINIIMERVYDTLRAQEGFEIR
ncbi:phenylalanine--tRNA ligase subunit beta [Candidatus Wolfebacteria bacterium]|nr:phenylalanine--tRNA ligase subunit beta [Candidatus Wolfebacteria bacterium]